MHRRIGGHEPRAPISAHQTMVGGHPLYIIEKIREICSSDREVSSGAKHGPDGTPGNGLVLNSNALPIMWGPYLV